ncbi:MAG TPA: hypothetical protein VFK02_34020 [Kofleriaceae bacterium]|nr:hypothetical protein [Kofleriaceae bacterium]
MVKRLAYRISVLVLAFAILCGHAAAETSPQVSAAVDAMSELLASGGADVDSVLCELGYCTEYTSQIAGWRELSPYRQIETMVLAAEKAEGGSAEDALALMAHALARDYPAILHHKAIVEITPQRSRRTLAFATLTTPSPARLEPRLDAAIYEIARHIDKGTLTASTVLREAGMPEESIMTLVREHRDVRDVLRAAVATQSAMKRTAFLSGVIAAIAKTHPTIVEHHAIKAFHAGSIRGDSRSSHANPSRRFESGTVPRRPRDPPSADHRPRVDERRSHGGRPLRKKSPYEQFHSSVHRR